VSESTVTAEQASVPKPAMGTFERFLTVWVALCIIAGIALGQMMPGAFHVIGDATVAQVNIPVAVLVWLMIVPMLLKIDLAALREVGQHWRGIASTVGVNWLIKPFSMALLAWIFVTHLFRPWLPADQISSYTAGLILLAAAPCTAMVFVWSNLVDGEPHFTLSQVALNDTIMVVAFAPIVGLLLGLSSITVPWNTLILSVILYIVVPVIAAQLWRHILLRRGGLSALSRHASRSGSSVPLRAAADTRAAVRSAGRADHAPADGDRAAGGAHRDPGLFQCGTCLLAEPEAGRRMVRGGALGADRGQQFFRTGGGDGDRPVRLSVGFGAGDGCRRAGRGAGHADRGTDGEGEPRLV
jgi:hypothetical protein